MTMDNLAITGGMLIGSAAVLLLALLGRLADCRLA